MVIAGKLSDNSSEVTLKVDGNTKKGSLGNIDPVTSINIQNSSYGIGLMTDADIQTLPEKLWAYLTIKQLQDERIASSDPVEKKKLSKRMLELSVKVGHSFLVWCFWISVPIISYKEIRFLFVLLEEWQ